MLHLYIKRVNVWFYESAWLEALFCHLCLLILSLNRFKNRDAYGLTFELLMPFVGKLEIA